MAILKPGGGRASSTSSIERAVIPVFVLASFLGSGLLFMVQPMVARMLLPIAGGSPSLWNTSMVFFQFALLAGYGYAHVSTNRLGMARHPISQVVLLAVPLLLLPISVSKTWRLPVDQSPVLWVLTVLALVVGLPFFVLSTSSPTLQRWFAATGHPNARDPYFLYAAGNLGSVLALVSYPFLVEPLLSLTAQTRLWAMLYLAFVALSAAAAWMTWRNRDATRLETDGPMPPSIAPGRRVRWVLWSFVPSALMLGVTRHIATDVASVPLLWIVPLLLYLSTFIIAFGRVSDRRTRWSSLAVRFGVIPLALSFVLTTWSLPIQIVLHLGWFFAAALLGHSRLSEDRPAPERLTEFYLWISIGGVLGGAFAALIAPLLFTTVLEYPIAIALAVLLVGWKTPVVSVPGRVTGSVVAILLALAWFARVQRLYVLLVLLVLVATINAALTFRRPASYAATIAFALLVALLVQPSGVLANERSFFGVYRVRELGGYRVLDSGTTVHGTQAAPGTEGELSPTSYYHPAGPLGQLIAGAPSRVKVGIMGLGVGGIAAYGRSGDRYTFFEIDPTVVEIAENTEYFSYLSRSEAEVVTILGDARLSLVDSTDRFDILLMDAFNSDAIPIHLVTLEAVESYLARLEEDGVLAVHISNRHFDMEPVLRRLASELGLESRIQFHHPTPQEKDEGSIASVWVVLARQPGTLDWADDRWRQLSSDGPLWTDDYSDILSVLKF